MAAENFASEEESGYRPSERMAFLQGEGTARDEWAVFRMDEKKARNKFF